VEHDPVADAALRLLKTVPRERVEFRRTVDFPADGADQVRARRAGLAPVGTPGNLGQVLPAWEVDLSLSLGGEQGDKEDGQAEQPACGE
jgi:hypothetical protein